MSDEVPSIPVKNLLPGLPNSGIISYGGYVFNVLGKYDVQGDPVYDEAERVVVCVKYTLRCTGCVMTPNVTVGITEASLPLAVETLNAQMDALQDVLMKPGLPLVIQDIGFDHQVLTALFDEPSPTPDLIWGAKPRGMKFRFHGLIATEFDWECEFNVSRCMYGNVKEGVAAPMAWNYEQTFAVNEEGLTQRTTTGYLQSAAIRSADANNPNKVLFDVEELWDKFTVNVPNGFRRAQNVRSINKAKNRIDFALIDMELTSDAYPEGIVNCDIDYEIASRPPGLASFNCSIAGELTVAPGFPKSLALAKFLTILNAKIKELRQIALFSIQKVRPIPISFTMRHKLFSRSTYFGVNFFMAANLTSILEQSGMWNPIPGTGYQQWAKSMKDAGVWGQRGTAELRHDPKDDYLVTICLNPSDYPVGQYDTNHKYNLTGTVDTKADEQPDEEGDYLQYRNLVKPVKASNFTVHRYATQTGTAESVSAKDHVVQYQAAPDYYVVMEGYGARLGQRPDMPTLTSVGGRDVELLEQDSPADDVPVSLAFGHKIYRASWRLLYRVKGAPTAAQGEIPGIKVAVPEPMLGQYQ